MTDPILDLSPGKKIAGRYRIVGTRRQGGLSMAFETVDEETNERRELQFFSAGLFEASRQAREFVSMLSPWKQVSSPRVLRVRDVVEAEGGSLVLVTDYPPGASLRERLGEDGPFDPRWVVHLGCAMLEGLEAIHAASLVHGDVKPATIFLDPGEDADADPDAVLVDGGVTPSLWTVKDLGEQTALIGTPYYAPVEQFGGDSPSPQSDLYNVAAVLFECLAGTLPWPGRSILEVFQAKLRTDEPSIAAVAPDVSVDPALEAVVVKGCRADRHSRYKSAGEFLEKLRVLG